jgi:hypothetical protein
MIVILMVLTILVTVAFFGSLAAGLIAITGRLDSIGTGSRSSLAMITWGVRAVETETSNIPKEVPRLNEQLTVAADVLGKIDAGLVAIAGAAAAQEGYR